MRVEGGAKVMPKRAHGQVVEHDHALPVPLPAVYVSISPTGASQAGCREDSDRFEAYRALISRDGLAASCTLAALCFCQVWFCFLATGRADLFFYQGVASATQFAALLADTLLLTGVFVALWRLGNRMGRSRAGELLRDVAFLLFLVVPGNAMRGVYHPPLTGKLNLEYWRHASVQGIAPMLRLSAAGGLVVLVAALFCFHRQLVRIVFRTLVLLFPLVPFMAAEASWIVVWRLAHPPTGESSAGRLASPGRPGGIRPQRVVWIIFDEMDYRLAFETPTKAHLTEFNRLASQSLYAVHAYPPGGRTMISVPALLAGRLVTGSLPLDASDLQVQYEGEGGAVQWKAEQTILDLGNEKGWRTGVAGWYFPYSRVFVAHTETAHTAAWQYQGWRLALNPNRPFPGLMADEFRVLAEGKTRSLLGTPLMVREHKRVVREVVAEAIRKAVDPALDLVFLHLPVPHAPFFYDANTGGDAARSPPAAGYLDHLQLGDRVLGQIRQAMQDAGVADKTTLLVSSDHWNRESDLIDGKMDHRVPFLVNFRNQQGVRYAAPFNTILSRRLVTAVMNGELHNASEAARWIDREKGGLTESPYNRN
jgi:hypothetical protein